MVRSPSPLSQRPEPAVGNISVRKAAGAKVPRVAYSDPPGGMIPDVTCHDCRGVLDLSQPNEQDPDHLIGTCRCGRLFAVDVSGRYPLIRLVHFPRQRGRPKVASA